MDLQTWLRQEWDRVLGVVFVLVGAVALYAGYQGIADSAYVAEQLAYLASGGLGGVSLVAVGATFLIRSYLHDHWRQLDSIEGAIRSSVRAETLETDSPSGIASANGDARSLVETE